MPKIPEFFGMSIYMYYREHGPPHFHVRYGEEEALVGIQALSLIEGELSPRVRGLVAEWASRNQEELLRSWRRARAHRPLRKIDPLDER